MNKYLLSFIVGLFVAQGCATAAITVKKASSVAKKETSVQNVGGSLLPTALTLYQTVQQLNQQQQELSAECEPSTQEVNWVNKMIKEVLAVTGITATAGIGTNMYLAKIAMDIVAKHSEADIDGVRIAELDEISYRQLLWNHRPLTDFWRVGPGIAKRLERYGIFTMEGVAHMDEDVLYHDFGVDAELLIDHAWGREPTTIADVKAYKSKAKSLSAGQVLMRDYSFSEAEIIAKEMMDQLCLDMAAKKLATDSVSLYIGYSYTYGVPGVGGTAQLAYETNAASVIVPAIGALYRRIVNPSYGIRRVCLCCNNVVEDHGHYQLNMFEDTTKQLRILIPEDMNYTGAFDDIFEAYTSGATLEKVKTTNMGTLFELTYQVQMKKDADEKKFIDEIRCRNGNLKIMLSANVPSGEKL